MSARSMENVMRFSNKVAVVTGSSAGIGPATARRLIAEGALVVLNARRGENLFQSAADLPKDRVYCFVGDVSIASEATALIAAAVERFGRIDLLVNNASSISFAELAS